jgi:ATP-dependent Zn protease
METLSRIFVSWAPMIILIAVWIIYMRKVRGTQGQTMDHLRKQNELMKDYIKITDVWQYRLNKLPRKKGNSQLK